MSYILNCAKQTSINYFSWVLFHEFHGLMQEKTNFHNFMQFWFHKIVKYQQTWIYVGLCGKARRTSNWKMTNSFPWGQKSKSKMFQFPFFRLGLLAHFKFKGNALFYLWKTFQNFSSIFWLQSLKSMIYFRSHDFCSTGNPWN